MRLVHIPPDAKATFLSRKNRFLAEVSLEGERTVPVHVHDPGRLKEILFPGNEVLLRHACSPGRKTEWDIIAGKVDGNWILVHAAYHRAAAQTALLSGAVPCLPEGTLRAEVPLGKSRIDFCITSEGRNTWVEVKGCSLERNGVALFPDAPSERASRHVRELMAARSKGDGAAVLVLVFGHGAQKFMPNEDTDPLFATTLQEAMDAGVCVYPLLCPYDGEWIVSKGLLPVDMPNHGK